MVWAAFAAALVLRLVLVSTVDHSFTDGLELRYLVSTLSMASGQGLLHATQDAATEQRADTAARERQIAGGRIDPEHPYPISARGYVPATLHPPGYSLLLLGYYAIGNFDGMVMLTRVTSALLDASVCVFLFLFVRNLFGVAPALVAAWVWVLLPAPMLMLLALKPDAFSCFFAALVLCLASYTRLGRPWAWAQTGVAVGVASCFRPEFLAWPAVLFVCAWIDSGRLWRSIAGAAMMGFAMLALLSPWLLWTYHAEGRPMLSSASAGGSMYEALGEDPANPWGVKLNDAWVDDDARKRGFTTAWSPEADEFYRKLYWQCVREHPGAWVRNIVVNRLPGGLVPLFELPSSDHRFFYDYRQREGLTRLGVVMKHPDMVLKHKGPALLMATLSALLAVAMLAAAVIKRRRWRQATWLVLPWLFVIAALSVVKQIEPRNVVGLVVLQASAAGVVIEHVIAGWQRRWEARGAARPCPMAEQKA